MKASMHSNMRSVRELISRCQTRAEFERLDRVLTRLYVNGCLSSTELMKADVLLMETQALKLSKTENKR